MSTIAATMSGLRPVSGAKLGGRAAAAGEPVLRLSRGQTAAVATSIVLGVMVAGFGLAGSYVSISDLAGRHQVPRAESVPSSVDGDLVAVGRIGLGADMDRRAGRLALATGPGAVGGHGGG